MLMPGLANPLHTQTGLALALIHTHTHRLQSNHSTTQAVGEHQSKGMRLILDTDLEGVEGLYHMLKMTIFFRYFNIVLQLF